MDGFWSVLVVMIVAGDENESLTSLETALSYTYIAMTFLAHRGINSTRVLTHSSGLVEIACSNLIYGIFSRPTGRTP